MKIFFVVACAALLAEPALAGETFDEIAYCRSVASYAGGSYQIEETCRQGEIKAKRALAARSIPSGIYNHCYQVGKYAGGSNQILETCIEQELAAKSRLGYR